MFFLFSAPLDIWKKHQEFILNVVHSMTGGVAAQAISIAAAPIVTRLFTPSDFGIASLFVSLCMIFVPASTLCFDLSIILPRKDEEASRIAILSVASLCVTTLVITTLIMVLKYMIPWLNHFQMLRGWIYMVPPSIFLLGLGTIMIGWNTRLKTFKKIATAQAASAAATSGFRIALGLAAGSSVCALIMGIVAGLIVQCAILMKQEMNRTFSAFPSTVAELKVDIRQYRDFPLFSLPTRLLTSFTQQLPVIMIGYAFSPAVLGFYAIANRLLSLPLRVISDSVRRVFSQKIAEQVNANHKICAVLLKTTVTLFVIGVLPALAILLVGEELFSLLLGKDWSSAGKYAAILAPWLLSRFMLQPSNTVFWVLRRQKLLFNYQLAASIIKILCFPVAFYLGIGASGTVLTFSLVAASMNFGIIAIAFFLSGTCASCR